jgi:hypothetical protein
MGQNCLEKWKNTWSRSKNNLKAVNEKQKSYADKDIILREFKVGEHVFLKVKPKKSSLNLGSYTELASKYCDLFEILDRIRPIAYMLPLYVAIKVHNVFYMSLLKKYVHDPNHLIYWNLI